MDIKRVECIDSLRGIACLIVLVAHIISTNSTFGIYARGCGKIGVWCFMVLSGFLTFLPYALKNEIKIENKRFYIMNYYKKKFIKLYPGYLITLLLALVFKFLVDKESVFNHLILQEGYGHFWYMPVIIKFYIIVPFLVMLLEVLGKKTFIVVLTLVGALFSVVFPFTKYVENSICIFWYLPVFLIGSLLAFVYVKLDVVHSKMINMMLVISCVGIVVLTPIMRQILFEMEPSGWLQNKYLVFAFLWSFIIVGILKNERISRALSNCRFLRIVGDISYEMYLVHYLVMWKITQYTSNILVVAIAVYGISFVVAMMVKLLIRRNKN